MIMKRLTSIVILAVIQVVAFAQRGKVRPEWDIDNASGSYHNIDDDMWSSLLIIGCIILFFLFSIYYRGKRSKKEETKRPPSKSSIGEAYDRLENGCSTIGGIGCLISVVLGLLIGLLSICSKSDKSVDNKSPLLQRKDKTFVNVIFSEDNNIQSHEATQEEFIGKDTVLYYEHFVYQNKTGRSLTEYLIEYCNDGTCSLEILKTIKPDQFFKSNVTTPFQKPPLSVEFTTTHVQLKNWKS